MATAKKSNEATRPPRSARPDRPARPGDVDPGLAGPPPLQAELQQFETEFLPLNAQARRRQLSEPRHDIVRWGLVAVAAAALLAALFVGTYSRLDEGQRGLAVALALLAVASALTHRLPERWLIATATLVFALASVAMVLFAGTLGRGGAAPGLGALGVLCALAGIASGVWPAIGVTLISLAGFLTLHLAPQVLPFVAPTPPLPPVLDGVALVIGVLVVLVGLGCGLGVRWVVQRYLAQADDREQRISGLLAVAVDAHWELDAQLRLTAINDSRDEGVSRMLRGFVGRPPWELPAFGCEPEVLDEARADLEARAPFRDLPVYWQSRTGQLRHFRVSGEPRFDEQGQFRGYWGVARETTVQVRVHAALEATESRYQELFARIPSPLVIHRGARVIDANPAALRLFGYEDVPGFAGRDLLDAYEGGDSRERARRRAEALDELPAGEAVPVADFRLVTHDGRHLVVRAAGVRIDVPGGPATLSIFVDDTDRRRAEEAVRRSEALLSHLVATSPDVITLTDLETGRYSMVNHTFETMTGYTSSEVVGRTSFEIGIWADPAERDRFIAAMRENGQIREMPCNFVAKSGAVVQMLISGAVFVMDRRKYLVINGRDVTAQERSRLERDAILENASIGIAVTRGGRFVVTNPRLEQMFGFGPGELVGQHGHVVWSGEDDGHAGFAEIAPRLESGELVVIERTGRRRDGTTFLARVQGKLIDPTHPARGGTIWLIEDITQQRQVAEALARARDEAEAANRAKSAFLANTSHELRTPLNGMLGLAQLARDPQLDAVRREQYLDQIVDNARALAAILSDVLDFSKIEAGRLELEQTSFDLSDLLNTLRQGYGALAAGRGLTLRFDTAPGLGHVRGDPLRVRQVLSNFLSNAIKFTPDGEVRVVTRRVGEPAEPVDRVRFEVHDSGPGIDARTQARLFKPFTQADESTTRRFGGTGLGLSICRELAHLMGGEVGVTSAPGQGACFWAELSLPRVASPARSLRSIDGGALDGARVLMVEDNAVNMLIGVALLQRWGAVVEQATDGREAVAAVQAAHERGEPFDLVLMDVQMPVMSGHEATRALRASAAGATLPIIALTAAALVAEREEALASGMNDFLTKPIDAERLRQALVRWAGQAGSSVEAPQGHA